MWPDVHRFWFGQMSSQGSVKPSISRRWFRKDAAFDRAIKQRFGNLLEGVRAGRYGHWCDHSRGRLALILVCDQFSRNIYRDSPLAFRSDAQARILCKEGLNVGVDRVLSEHERAFYYLPLEHSESLADQELSCELFAGLADTATVDPAMMRSCYEYAIRHREIIARFGRFPHRNACLGRANTPEEATFLTQPGSRF